MSSLSIILGDATKLDIPSGSVDLIITHPPYFGIDTKRYGGNELLQINHSSRNSKQFLKLLRKATKEMYRVLKPTGQLWIANGKDDNLDMRYVIDTLDNTDFVYVDFIHHSAYNDKAIFDKKSYKISSDAVTTWHHFSKGQDIYFNPFTCRKNNNAIWEMDFANMTEQIDKDLFDKGYAVQDSMNSKLVEKLIDMFSKPGYTVLDPFGGTGIVPITAVKMGRDGILNDISEKQLEGAKIRAQHELGDNYDR